MKKVISILIVAALLMSLMVSAFATDAEVPTLTVGSATAEVGDEVTLEVTMSETKYAAYGLEILYDAEALELVSVDEGDEALKFFTANIETGLVTDFSNKDTKVDGVIFTMTFKVLAAGEHTVELAIDSFNMADQSEIEVAAVAGTISVAGANVPEVENPLVDGDNTIELPMGSTEAVVYNYVATETGTLYVAITEYKYSASWTEGAYEDEFDMYDFTEGTTFTVNGETLSGIYYGAVEVVAGEVYTFSWSINEDCNYGFLATLNLSYTDENMPVLGIDIPLTRADLPMNTVEIPAGEQVTYLVSAFDFEGYVLTLTGENFYVAYQMYDYGTWEMVTVTLEPVDGVIELDVGTNYIQEFQIGNSGSEPVTVALDCYAPLGGIGNPIIVETLDEVETTIMPGVETYTYFQWTATEVGTVWITYGNIYVNFENRTSGEYGEYDDNWENYGVYVEAGDVVLIAIGGYVEEETFYELPYWFEAGYRPGTEQNPIEIDLLEPLAADLYNETIYYTWTPEQSMVLTLNYTLKYTWSSNVPTIVINGETYTLGEELTVTAGEPVSIVLSTEPSVYGTLEATVVEIIEELPEVENPLTIGDNVIELPMGTTEPSVYNFVATETGTLYITAVEFLMEASWTDGYEDNSQYMEDWINNTIFTVNGEELSGGFYGTVEVVEGEVYTFSWTLQEFCTWGFKATINLSYSDENMPVPGIDMMLMPSDLPTTTVEIPAGGEQLYKFSYDFAGYIITITGENAYITFQTFNYEIWDYETVRIDAVDGVVEYDMNVYGMSEIYIGNEGTEAATFELDYYAPEGGPMNPIIVENLEDIYAAFAAGQGGDIYFQWTSDKLGTIFVDTSVVNINIQNLTKDETGEFESDWITYKAYVEPGDVVMIVLSAYPSEDLEYYFTYDFVEGYRLGSELNPNPVDLLEGVYVNMYGNTVYYTWTPAEDMTVTIDFTLEYNWSERVPVIVVNGEPYTLGEELTVTAGEPVLFNLSAPDGSVYGTLQATKVAGEEPAPEVIYEGEMTVETTDTYGYFDLYSLTAPVTGTYTFHIPAGLGVITPEALENWGAPIIDFYDNVDGYDYVVDLTEGDVFEFYVGAVTTGEWTITYTVVENEGGEGGDPTPVLPDIYDLTIGNNSINAADIGFSFTATENGTLILNLGNPIMGSVEGVVTVNGENEQTLAALGQITLELVAGDEVLIIFTAEGYATMTAEWETEGGEVECEHEYVDGVCIHCGEEDPNYQPPTEEPDGTSGNPFIVEELPYEAVQETTDDLYYKWTATENGTLYIYYTDGMCALSGSSLGSWDYADGGKSMKVAAGDVITINYWSGTGFTLEFVADSGEAEPGTEGNPIAIDTLNITLTAADDGIYYAWTATEAGEIVIRVAECTWGYGYSLTVNGESLYGEGAELTVNVEAGDQIIIMIVVYPSASSDGHLTLEQVVEVPHEHNHVITDSKDATCTEDGYVTYTCECGDTYTETVTATGHTFVDGVCTNCGELDPDYNPDTGSLNVMALALIAGMSVAAVVVTARKKSDEE